MFFDIADGKKALKRRDVQSSYICSSVRGALLFWTLTSTCKGSYRSCFNDLSGYLFIDRCVNVLMWLRADLQWETCL